MIVRIRVQNPEGDREAFDPVEVDALPEGRLRVLNSPALVENLAAGDVICLAHDGTFDMVERGGNLCVQFCRSKEPNADAESVLTDSVRGLGGRLDAAGKGVLVFTVPVRRTSFQVVEAAFNTAVANSPGASWMFGNVYAPGTEQPLNWWT